MRSTTAYRRGDVVLVAFPFTDLSSTKQRPALVVSPDDFNASRQDVVLAALTSQIPDELPSDVVMVGSSDVSDGGLPKDSIVKVSKLFTMHRTLIRKRIGRLGAEKLSNCLDALRDFFS